MAMSVPDLKELCAYNSNALGEVIKECEAMLRINELIKNDLETSIPFETFESFLGQLEAIKNVTFRLWTDVKNAPTMGFRSNSSAEPENLQHSPSSSSCSVANLTFPEPSEGAHDAEKTEKSPERPSVEGEDQGVGHEGERPKTTTEDEKEKEENKDLSSSGLETPAFFHKKPLSMASLVPLDTNVELSDPFFIPVENQNAEENAKKVSDRVECFLHEGGASFLPEAPSYSPPPEPHPESYIPPEYGDDSPGLPDSPPGSYPAFPQPPSSEPFVHPMSLEERHQLQPDNPYYINPVYLPPLPSKTPQDHPEDYNQTQTTSDQPEDPGAPPTFDDSPPTFDDFDEDEMNEEVSHDQASSMWYNQIPLIPNDSSSSSSSSAPPAQWTGHQPASQRSGLQHIQLGSHLQQKQAPSQGYSLPQYPEYSSSREPDRSQQQSSFNSLILCPFTDEWISGKNITDGVTIMFRFKSLGLLCLFFKRLKDSGGEKENTILQKYDVQRVSTRVYDCSMEAFVSRNRLNDFQAVVSRVIDQINSTPITLAPGALQRTGYSEDYKIFLELKRPRIDHRVAPEILVLPGGKKITFLLGDLMKEKTDAIVNPANEQLTNHGGISNQIVKFGGPAITRDCQEFIKRYRVLPTGSAFVGGSGTLPCRRVIHTVGPVYKKHNPAENERLLILSVENCIKHSEKNSLSIISMPFISSGIFGYPLKEVIRIMVSTIARVLPRMTRVNEVRLIHSDPESWSQVICPFVRHLNRAPPVPALPPTPYQAIVYYYDAPLFDQFISDHVPN